MMPKAIKGNAGRKPPEPSANHSDIDDWCRHLMPDLQPIVKRLDELIRATVPDLDYAVHRKRAYYGLPELGWIIEIAAYDVSVNVFSSAAPTSSPRRRSERPTGPGTSRSPAWRRRSDRSCRNGSNKRGAPLVGRDGHRLEPQRHGLLGCRPLAG